MGRHRSALWSRSRHRILKIWVYKVASLCRRKLLLNFLWLWNSRRRQEILWSSGCIHLSWRFCKRCTLLRITSAFTSRSSIAWFTGLPRKDWFNWHRWYFGLEIGETSWNRNCSLTKRFNAWTCSNSLDYLIVTACPYSSFWHLNQSAWCLIIWLFESMFWWNPCKRLLLAWPHEILCEITWHCCKFLCGWPTA